MFLGPDLVLEPGRHPTRGLLVLSLCWTKEAGSNTAEGMLGSRLDKLADSEGKSQKAGVSSGFFHVSC